MAILLILIPNKNKWTVEKVPESVCSGFPHCVVWWVYILWERWFCFVMRSWKVTWVCVRLETLVAQENNTTYELLRRINFVHERPRFCLVIELFLSPYLVNFFFFLLPPFIDTLLGNRPIFVIDFGHSISNMRLRLECGTVFEIGIVQSQINSWVWSVELCESTMVVNRGLNL